MTFTAGEPLLYPHEGGGPVSFRQYNSDGTAEVLTLRGSRIVNVRDLAPIR